MKELVTKSISTLLATLLLLLLVGNSYAGFNTSSLRNQLSGAVRNIKTNIRQALIPVLNIRRGVLGDVTGLQAGADGRFLVTRIQGNELRIWDAWLGYPLALPDGLKLSDIASIPGSNDLLMLDQQGNVHIKPFLATPRQLVHDSKISSILATGDRQFLLLDGSGRLSLWDAGSRMQIASHRLSVKSDGKVQFHDGHLLATGQNGIEMLGLELGRFYVVKTWQRKSADHGILQARLVDDASVIVLDDTDALYKLHITGDQPEWRLTGIKTVSGVQRGLLAAIDQTNRVLLVNTDTGQVVRRVDPEIEVVNSVALMGEDQWLVLGGDRGITHIFTRTGEPLLRLVNTKYGWGVVDNQGRYDTEESGIRDVTWLAGGIDLELDRFSELYYEPGLLPKTLKHLNAPMLTRPNRRIEDGIFLPPVVTFENELPAVVNSRQLDVYVNSSQYPAEDAGYPGELRVYHNGKRIKSSDVQLIESVNDRERELKRWKITVDVVPGDNDLRVVSVAWGKIESDPLEHFFSSSAGEVNAVDHYITSVGINRYEDPSLNLNYAVADATAVFDRFGQLNEAIESSHGLKIIDQHASRSRILRALAALKGARPEDFLLLFFAGHGESDGDDWYFLSHNMKNYQQSEDALIDASVSADDLVELLLESPARRVVLIVDACYSGMVAERIGRFAQMRAMKDLNKKTGVHVFAATRGDQQAPEFRELGHGLLTYTLLQALEKMPDGFSRADLAPRDGHVTVSELQVFISDTVPRLGNQLLRKVMGRNLQENFLLFDPVTPVVGSFGKDFVVD
ncbi:MAG: caspase family protein [Sedimenticola sp.]